MIILKQDRTKTPEMGYESTKSNSIYNTPMASAIPPKFDVITRVSVVKAS